MRSSRIPGFHRLSPEERQSVLFDQTELSDAGQDALKRLDPSHLALADNLTENAIGAMAVPLGIAPNLIIDGRDVLVPMATEESSVIAAVGNASKLCRSTGGVTTTWTGPVMIAQVQILNTQDAEKTKAFLEEKKPEIGKLCDACDPMLVSLGGGFRNIDLRVLETRVGPMVVLHLIIDTRDAMGANAVNTMAEAIAPHVEEWLQSAGLGGAVNLRILSNLADRRVVTAEASWRVEEIGGETVRDAMIAASAFAEADPYRAATHNKGIMNGVSAVMLATGNDTRAVEAGAHAFAARDGRYTALSRWDASDDGALLIGTLSMPLACGTIGGAARAHPTARAALELLRVEGGGPLARIAAAVGLVQNFAALRALSTTGIQDGHMRLHARNIAIAAGAVGEEIATVAQQMIASRSIRQDVAEAILLQLHT